MRLNYTPDWLNVGILTEGVFESQLQEFAIGEDTNTEHFRYRTFAAYLSKQATFSDTQIQNIIQIFQLDQDKAMAGASLARLLKVLSLTDKQFTEVSEALIAFGSWTEKR